MEGFTSLSTSKFQSTHPRGVRQNRLRSKLVRSYFNPRTHEGCDSAESLALTCTSDFNPRTHEGCDHLIANHKTMQLDFNPRTHEGCDRQRVNLPHFMSISIHAPTRGATTQAGRKTQLKYISIHAPTRGATMPTMIRVPPCYFNPRTHEGCDPLSGPIWIGCTVFQSTHPRGVRHNGGGM